MDSFNLSLDELAKETFALGEQLTFQNLSAKSPFDSEEDLAVLEPETTEEVQSLPQGCGLIYKIEKTSGTFCIRAYVASNISQVFKNLEDGDEEIQKKLKLSDETKEELFYFETCSIERAEVIHDQMCNRRFPLDEDMLCNISDPGFSWWMNIGEGGFQIYFTSHGLNRADRFLRLGPLGDNSIAAMRFRQLEEHLVEHFPLSEISISEKSVKINTSALDNRSFYVFQSIFTDGINETREEDFIQGKDQKTLFYYLQEISTLRTFWLNIEGLLTVSE